MLVLSLLVSNRIMILDSSKSSQESLFYFFLTIYPCCASFTTLPPPHITTLLFMSVSSLFFFFFAQSLYHPTNPPPNRAVCLLFKGLFLQVWETWIKGHVTLPMKCGSFSGLVLMFCLVPRCSYFIGLAQASLLSARVWHLHKVPYCSLQLSAAPTPSPSHTGLCFICL